MSEEPIEGAEGPESRGRITFETNPDLHQSARLLAAHRGISLSALAREALAQLIERASIVEDEDLKVGKRESRAEKKRKFLRAIERRYYPILAARAIGVPLSEVLAWAEKDTEFAEQIDEAALYFVTRLEMTQIRSLRSTKRNAKDRFLFWQSFMNAHNPHHGRFKADAAARDYRGFIDETYKIIERELTSSQAKSVIEKIKKMAERRLAKLGD